MTSDADYKVNPADRSFEVAKMVSSTERRGRRRQSPGKGRRRGRPDDPPVEPTEPDEAPPAGQDDQDDPHDVDYYA